MTYNDFLEFINSDTPTLAYFNAAWCKPCRAMSIEIDKLSVQLKDRFVLLNIDIDAPENYKITQAYNIYSVPTIIIFRNGAPAWRISGAVTSSYLQRIISKLPSAPKVRTKGGL